MKEYNNYNKYTKSSKSRILNKHAPVNTVLILCILYICSKLVHLGLDTTLYRTIKICLQMGAVSIKINLVGL